MGGESPQEAGLTTWRPAREASQSLCGGEAPDPPVCARPWRVPLFCPLPFLVQDLLAIHAQEGKGACS